MSLSSGDLSIDLMSAMYFGLFGSLVVTGRVDVERSLSDGLDPTLSVSSTLAITAALVTIGPTGSVATGYVGV